MYTNHLAITIILHLDRYLLILLTIERFKFEGNPNLNKDPTKFDLLYSVNVNSLYKFDIQEKYYINWHY